ncbi:calcium-binding protein [Aureimonas pseudogalii]|uniref:Ca2+-binding RTX toxin-like protein n=1 Tax=Aureimonas pseudogalii TaxID=1744844 RepID=A0A7W6H8N7_9HYPH|nr:calcium-binding protein [Aureimonas pseudogalii]MBB4000641.1 Ca2+-binding RTX toxin-like protein [Aureimonas pseudogalii]
MAKTLDTAGRGISGTAASFSSYETIRVSQQDLTTAVDLQIEGGGVLNLAKQLSGQRAVNVMASDTGNTLTGGSLNDRLLGGAGKDILNGGNGDDYLAGQFSGMDTADDVLSGGAGRDEIYDYGGRVAINGGTGDDRIFVGGDVTGGVVDGGADWDVLGWSGRTDISGLTIRNVEVLETAGENITGTAAQFSAFQRIVTFNEPTTTPTPITLTVAGKGTLDLSKILSGQQAATVFASDAGNTLIGGSKNDALYGGLSKDSLDGGAGDDTLDGGEGDDTLDGGDGADTMIGGLGSDIYHVDHSGDLVEEIDGEGTDTVYTSVNFALTDAQSIETLIATAGTDPLALVGNGLANRIVGNAGDNRLNGGAGADQLVGGTGDDTYIVDDAGDVVVEVNGRGLDTVVTSVDYKLSDSQSIEVVLAANGSAPLTLTGNRFDNKIVGNDGDNRLDGGAGADILDGGVGADVMTGGNDSDTFFVDNLGDVVIEQRGIGGTDSVHTSVNFQISESQGIEELFAATGTSGVRLGGNSLANRIVGNEGNNILDGGAGNDQLIGGAGSDSFVFSTVLSRSNVDVIKDFSVVEDTIWLDHDVFSGFTGFGALSADAFLSVAGGKAQDAFDRIIYDNQTGDLFFDADGSGRGAAIKFAELDAGLRLTADDFLLI